MDIPEGQKVDVVIDLPIYLLQTLRLVHAIAETGFRICVEPEDEKAVVRLKKTFGMDYRVGTAGAQRIAGLYLDHLKPVTRIGSFERPLVMPKAIFDYCRARWPHERGVDVSFAGLLTQNRRTAINEWLSVPAEPTFLGTQFRKLARRLNFPIEDEVGTRNVKIFSSDRGRHFPLKSWNTAYYKLMLDSKFVLCPSGDFKANGVAWTYRFFEGVLCGTIPVVEEPCAAYEGYRFHLMSDPLPSLQWSREAAEHNFALAREQMVLDSELLRAEVLRLLAPIEGKHPVEPDHAPEVFVT